ncbi:MAG: FkbM family methyltransferase [Rhizobacter sp.]|nr:FkbM family methyltransferase [Bacteriovorax sp.]
MKNIITSLNKAEYFFRPAQLVKRLLKRSAKTDEKNVIAILPWGHEINVSPSEDIGKAIMTLGLYDLTVSEVIHRLCRMNPAEEKVVLDVGANIGYMTSVLSQSLSQKDKVISFEPHPAVFNKLKKNAASWNNGAKIELENLALSNESGFINLMIPSNFKDNEGLGFLATALTEEKTKDAVVCKKVKTMALDEYWNSSTYRDKNIFLMKIDTEGNELLVLQGAKNFLAQKRVQHILFEEHELYPAASMLFLEKMGYTIYFLKRGFLSPRLIPVKETTKETWEPNNFLATLSSEVIEKNLSAWGWKILH